MSSLQLYVKRTQNPQSKRHSFVFTENTRENTTHAIAVISIIAFARDTYDTVPFILLDAG